MDSSLVAIRWSLYADLGLLFGLLLFALYALKASERERLLPLRWLTTVLAGLGIVLSGLSFVLAVAAMLGVALKDVDHASVMMILTETPVGWALLARMLALTILCAAVLTPWARSEEHTSELQSLMRISYAVFCLKKKITNNTYINR